MDLLPEFQIVLPAGQHCGEIVLRRGDGPGVEFLHEDPAYVGREERRQDQAQPDPPHAEEHWGEAQAEWSALARQRLSSLDTE